MKLFDAELKLMEVLWREGNATASRLAELMSQQYDWKKTTTYTFIKRCIEKGAVGRSEPNFVCRPLVSVEEVRAYETTGLINRMFGGAGDLLVASLLDGAILSKNEIERLKRLVQELE
jgi:predicted transcriptional regulator